MPRSASAIGRFCEFMLKRHTGDLRSVSTTESFLPCKSRNWSGSVKLSVTMRRSRLRYHFEHGVAVSRAGLGKQRLDRCNESFAFRGRQFVDLATRSLNRLARCFV